ncbi:elongation factor 1-beta [Candidatus Woesearchaeota archaeon]|nr:MAG: elongation factor 1-beta [Candidatus Woesearchaeota archaeon]
MANVIITLKIMPKSTDVNLDEVEKKATELIAKFGGDVGKTSKEPIAFGLRSLNIIFVMDEAKGSTEELENSISELDGVNSVEVIDVRRAIG